MKKLYYDVGGECEYYILKVGEMVFTAHGFEPAGQIPEEDGWKHYEMHVELTPEDIERATLHYGEENVEFMAAMDELQSWCNDYELITEEEKTEIIEEIERENPGE